MLFTFLIPMEVDSVYEDFHRTLENPIKTLFLTCLYVCLCIYISVCLCLYLSYFLSLRSSLLIFWMAVEQVAIHEANLIHAVIFLATCRISPHYFFLIHPHTYMLNFLLYFEQRSTGSPTVTPELMQCA